MQASSSWSPPTGTLGGLVAEAHVRAAKLLARRTELAREAGRAAPGVSLRAALQRPDVAVVAEVKRRSPSKGWINATLSAADQARAYAAGGAAAISVLTEPNHFAGSSADLTAVQDAVALPVLKKDFHVAPVQLVEARALGANAALVIVRAVAPEQVKILVDVAADIGLELVTEVRDEAELDLALTAGSTIIGINNRDLETLRIDPEVSTRLLSLVPRTVVAIAESGVSARAEVDRVAAAGANAVLVGSSLSAAGDPERAVRALTGVPRRPRGG